MQEILRTDPYYADIASKEGRLYLARTKGSLSGGTRVRMVGSDPDYKLCQVAARVRSHVKTEPYSKIVEQVVTVTLDDLVIRRMSCHPDQLNNNQPRPRAERRREEKAAKQVLQRLQREKNK